MTVGFNGIGSGSGQVNPQKTQNDKPQGPQTPAPAPEQSRQQSVSGENVSLSSQAQNLKQVEQSLDTSPEVDDARIEQIKAALSDGSFKVDAEKLAQKMLDMDNTLFK